MQNKFSKKYKIIASFLVVSLHLSPALAYLKGEQVVNKNLVNVTIVNQKSQQIKQLKKQEILKAKKQVIENKNSSKKLTAKEKQILENLEKKELVKNEEKKPETNYQADKKIANSSSVKYKIGTFNNPAPQYPASAMRRGYQGLVNVCAKVDDSGKPISATICKSSGFNSLDFAALKTIKKWKFFISKNTESANKRIVHNVNVPINFVIN